MKMFKKIIDSFSDSDVDVDNEPLVKTTKFEIYDEEALKNRKQSQTRPKVKETKERLLLESSVDKEQAKRIRYSRYKSLLIDDFITQEEFDLLNDTFNEGWNYN